MIRTATEAPGGVGVVRWAPVVGVTIASALLLGACQRESRDYNPKPYAETAPTSVEISELRPGGAPAPTPDPRDKIYLSNAYHIGQGQRLYRWFNCNGCHFNGGGGIGPALMDDQWRYGGSLDQIYASISDGRPNGMPAWKDKIPSAQIWQIAAFVKSLSGGAPSAAAGSRADEMSSIPPPDLMKPSKPKDEAANVQGGTP
jgi:cytochrome c oxidase cbb3-type subunit 3